MVEDSMIERGSHPHHEEPEIMPEFFGGEKLERKYWSGDVVKRAVGARSLKEIKPDASTAFGRFVDSFKTISDTELTPELLEREAESLREIRRQEELTSDQREQADKIARAIGRKLKRLEEVEGAKVPPEEALVGAAEKMARETEKVAEAVEGQRAATERAIELQTLELKLPPKRESEAQLAVVRPLLERIEDSNTDCRGTADIHARVQRLETNLEFMEDSVAREVRTRLALHDCSELVKQANGWIVRKVEEVGPGYSIGSAITEAVQTRNHELTGDMIDLLLKEGLPGLEVAKAWDLLQEANFDYESKVAEVNRPLEEREKRKNGGEVPPNFYRDTNAERKKAVYDHLVNKLIQEKGLSQREADRSLKLAEKLTIATLETSVFNNASIKGNDQLAEIIHLKDWRRSRRGTGRNRGPKIHEEYIEGFGKSWLRQFRKKDKDRPLEAEKDKDRPLEAEKVDIEKIKEEEGDYSYWGTVLVLRYHLLRDLIMERQPKPLSIDKDFLQRAVVYFNTADRPKEDTDDICGPLCLRAWWLAGVVDVALAKEELEWDADAFNHLKRSATLEELSPESGTFIDREQWDWIAEETKLSSRVAKLGGRRGISGAFQKLLR